jgi:hypothetical protein
MRHDRPSEFPFAVPLIVACVCAIPWAVKIYRLAAEGTTPLRAAAFTLVVMSIGVFAVATVLHLGINALIGERDDQKK